MRDQFQDHPIIYFLETGALHLSNYILVDPASYQSQLEGCGPDDRGVKAALVRTFPRWNGGALRDTPVHPFLE